MCINDIEEIYDFVEQNKVNDIYEIIIYALSPSEDIKLNWLEVLGNDKMVDLFNCKIKEKNHLYNTNLIRKYYEQFIDNFV